MAAHLTKIRKTISLGKYYYKSSDHKQALKHFNKALVVARKHGLKLEETVLLDHISNSLFLLTRYEEVIDVATQGLKLSQEIRNRNFEMQFYHKLGISYSELGKYNEALKHFKEELKIALEFNVKERMANCYNNLGNAYKLINSYDNAIKCSKKGLEIFLNQNSNQGIANCYCSLSEAYKLQGKYSEAILYAKKRLEIERKSGNKKGEASALVTLSGVYGLTRNYKIAFELNLKALEIEKEIGDKEITARCLLNIGQYQMIFDKDEDALQSFLTSLKFSQEIGNERQQLNNLLLIGRCHSKLKNYDLSNMYNSKALCLAKDVDDKGAEAFLYFHIGENYLDECEYEQAITWLTKALEVASSIGIKILESYSNGFLGEVYYNLSIQKNETHDCLKKSEHYLYNALQCDDFIFKNLHERDDFKVNFSDNYLSSVRLLVSILLQTERPQQALLVSDHYRGRSLGDCLVSQYGMSQEKYIPPKQLTYQDVEKVVSSDTFTLVQYSIGNEIGDVAFIVGKEKFEVVKLSNADERSTERIHPILAEISKAYASMGIFAMSHENRSLDSYIESIDSHVKRGDDSFSLPDDSSRGTQALDSLELLYKYFIAPIIDHVKHDDITIVPEGFLYSIPFAALKDPNTGKYLTDTKHIRLAPSISLLRLLQECPEDHHSQNDALIIGDPDVGEVILRGKKINLPSLPEARKEAKFLGMKLGEIPLVGEKATKNAVLEKLKEGVAIIHIAAHASSDNGEIALAPNPSGSRQGPPDEEDYLLTMKDIQETGIKAKLVVLSCCHSGSGEFRAEGVVGVSRAFLAAGARAVVASLWAIEESVTLSFMVSFYNHLKKGKNISECLQESMKEIREEGKTEPKHWAPFFLIGDDISLFRKR